MEKIFKTLVVLVIGCIVIRFWWAHHVATPRPPAAAASSVASGAATALPARPVSPPSKYGFSPLPEPFTGPPTRLLVLASPTCTLAQNQRALGLVTLLKLEGLPCESTNYVHFTNPRNPTDSELAQLNAILAGAAPIVFINGKVSNNPSLDEIEGEYRATQ